MSLWEQLRKVDPDYVKEVNLGRRFKTVDATYRIQLLTDALGPIGEAWGYEAVPSTFSVGEEQYARVDVTLWRQLDERRSSWGPVTGCCRLVKATIGPEGVSYKCDTDAFKKALTDALTKAMSHLGVAADVFLGLYDDDKYVAAERARRGEEREYVDRIKVALRSSKTHEKLEKAKQTLDSRFADGVISEEAYNQCLAIYSDQKLKMG